MTLRAGDLDPTAPDARFGGGSARTARAVREAGAGGAGEARRAGDRGNGPREGLLRRWLPRLTARKPSADLERDGGFRPDEARTSARDVDLRGEVVERHPVRGDLWTLRDGALFRSPGPEHEGEAVLRLVADAAPSCLRFLPGGAALLGFEDGRLWRWDGERARVVLELSDPGAAVRQRALALGPGGVVWAGEHGGHPDARGAVLHHSDDGGRSFRRAARFEAAHGVLLASVLRDGSVVAATGGGADERGLHVARRGRFRLARRAAAGFTAMVETAAAFHFGTDRAEGNALVAFRRGLRRAPEVRRLPAALDGRVRRLISAGPRLVALCVAGGARRGAAVLLSEDDGRTWSVVHRFAGDEAEPATLVVWRDEPLELLAAGAGGSKLIELG